MNGLKRFTSRKLIVALVTTTVAALGGHDLSTAQVAAMTIVSTAYILAEAGVDVAVGKFIDSGV